MIADILPRGSRRVRYALAAWMAVVLVLSTIPPGEIRLDLFHGADKVAHAVFYLVLAALATRVPRRVSRPGALWIAAFGLAAVYGGVIEIAQSAVGRDPNLEDWVADAVGAVVGATVGLAGTRTSEGAR